MLACLVQFRFHLFPPNFRFVSFVLVLVLLLSFDPVSPSLLTK